MPTNSSLVAANGTSPSRSSVTGAEIVAALHEVGVAEGDSVLVHSSLRSFGHVEGGADTVIEALLLAVGSTGTLAMPTFTWENFHDSHSGVFDVCNTPSLCGVITEKFRERSGVVRSSHLCHSVAAFGPHAADMVGECASPYAEGSAFAALLEQDAWNLFLGVDFGCCTLLHLVEERMQVPYRAYRDFKEHRVVHADGRSLSTPAIEFLRKPGYYNDFAKMGAVFDDAGIVRRARAGGATISNARMRAIVEVTQDCLRGDINYLLGS